MSKVRKSLKKPRTQAFKIQSGLCYYCGHPMWIENPSEFASKHLKTDNSVHLFQCTGEHLTPHSEGGSPGQSNIVAACWYCNQQRHRRKKNLSAERYREFVQRRKGKRRWNTPLLA